MDQAPRSLDNLLSTFKTQDAQVLRKIDQVITDNAWYRKFHQYLSSRDLEDEVNILKFLISMKTLESIEDAIKSSSKPKTTQKLEADLQTLFNEIIHEFFSEDASSLLALSNSKLSDALSTICNPSKDHMEWLKKAKNDPCVWAEGLDPVYKKFLASLPASNPIVACLLSIL